MARMTRRSAAHVVIASATTLPEPDHDEPALRSALERRGARVDVLAWDDPAAHFAQADVVVVRSTWNYVPRRDDFVAWAERVGAATRLWNPARVLRKNTDKLYLQELAAAGVPVVPTLFVERGEQLDLGVELDRRGWSDVVIKPRISASSWATQRFAAADRAAAAVFLARHLGERAMMVQPFMESVTGWGERSLVWIAGELTHATRKEPRFGSSPVEPSRGAVPIEDDERALAVAALDAVGEDLLYARVDLVRDEEDRPRIMEIELTEPYLMLGACEAAVERLADALVDRAR
jgi:glutathione synthase/RimK-type ligase-like ATP-grasp enzyme